MEVIFGELLGSVGVPAGIMSFLILSIAKGWLIPGRFYDEQKAAAAKWQESHDEQKEINRKLTAAVEEMNKGLGGSAAHFFTTLNAELQSKEIAERNKKNPGGTLNV